MKQDVILVDMDGTLCDIDHRLHFIEGDDKDFRAFYAACDKDGINTWCLFLIKALLKDDYIVTLLTARSKEVEGKTHKWLGNIFDMDHDRIVLAMVREEGDYTPDFRLKRDYLLKLGKERILFAVDDRNQVVKMYREEGIPVLQCADGDF